MEFTAPEAGHDVPLWVVRPLGDIDVTTAGEFADRLEAADASGAPVVVLELSKASFLDSSGIRAIVTAAARLDARGARLLIEGASGAVGRVLEISGLIDRLTSTHRSPNHPPLHITT